jgi:hypothetical protein
MALSYYFEYIITNITMKKLIMYSFITIGGLIGGYIPLLFGVDGFSVWAIIGSTIGGIVGIWVAYKISHNM